MTFLRACYIWIRFDANSPPRASPKNFNKKGKKIILAFSTPTIDYLGIRRTTSVSDGLPASTLNHSLATYVRNDFIRNQFHYAPNKRPCLSTGVIRIFTLAMLNLLELPQVHDKILFVRKTQKYWARGWPTSMSTIAHLCRFLAINAPLLRRNTYLFAHNSTDKQYFVYRGKLTAEEELMKHDTHEH